MSDPSSSPSASSLSPQSPIKRTSNGHGSHPIYQSSLAIFQEERLEGTLTQKATLGVVTTEKFLAKFFPNVEMTPEEEENMEKHRMALSYIDLKTIPDETRLSADLVRGINACCPPMTDGKELQYFDTHLKGASAEPIPGFMKRQAPDGLLTTFWSDDTTKDGNHCVFETANSSRGRFPTSLLTPISKVPGIIFEHKLPSKQDIDFAAGQTGSLTKPQADLWLQKHGYDMSQWSTCELYRLSIGVTIAGEYMRFWASAPSGSCASEAFEYRHDATPLFKLLHLYGRSTHSYDVGPDRMFQPIPQEDIPLIERSCRSIAKAYTKESQNKEWFIKWNNRLCEKPEEVAWSFHIDHHTAHRGVYSPNSPNKIVVLSVPIAHQTRIKSRGTRCYLAFDYALVDRNPFYKMSNKEIMKHVHTLKTSWISPLRSPEFEFYQKAIARQADAKAKGIKFGDFHMATMLSGGYIEGSLQDYSREHKSGMGSQKELPSQNARQINWLLMKEVGRPIGTFQNGREFLEVIRDTAKTLQALYDLRILHRDVSANNVLIDIVTGCGLLIDLDLAKDLDENQHSGRPAVTGTISFISLAFDDAQFPLHTLWHDLESLYWTALYISIRHRSHLSTGIKKICNLSEEHNRTLCLGNIFPNRQKEFLSIGEFNCSDDSALNHFILRMQDVYKQNYSLMDTFHLWVMFLATPLRGLLEMASKSEACIKKTKILDILSCLQAHKTHQMYEHQGKRELGEYIQGWLDLGQNLDAAYSHSFFEELPDALQEDIGNVHKGMRTVQSALQDLLFPDTELFLKYLNQALSGSKATSNHPGIKYNPPRQTTKEEQFRHGVGPLTHLSPTALSSHHSQTRFTVDNVINETDDGADDTEAGE